MLYWLVMRKFASGTFFLALLACSGCGKKIERQVQEAVRLFDNALLSADQVEVKSVTKSGDLVIAEIQVATAVKMVKKNGTWVVDEIRIGDRRWEKAEHILAVINEERKEATREQLGLISEGIRRYAEKHGQVPQVTRFEALVDVLASHYVGPVVRIDAWSNSFAYRPLSLNAYDLRSAGPDGALGTADDVVAGSQ